MGKRSWESSLLLAALAPSVIAQNCISLSGSKQCSAFQNASISTNSLLTGLYPFLSFVSSTETFDQQLAQYVNATYVQTKFQTLLGCSNVNLTNTTSYYARYTTSVICNGIIQNSVTPCGLSGQAAAPLCADSCAQHAITEEEIVVSKELCGTPGNSFIDQIRADFITCALPDSSLTGSCITGAQNEPDNCGFADSLDGLCRYCGASSPNATDSCCYNSNVTRRCSGVVLPSLGPMPSITFTTTTSATTTATATVTPSFSNADLSTNRSLSGGAIAGIVIGALIAAILLALLIFLVCVRRRRRRERYMSTSLNQPSPRRTPPSFAGGAIPTTAGSGRITRMTALEAASRDEKPSHMLEGHSDEDSPDSRLTGTAPITTRRQGSLSSNSALGAFEESSPEHQVSSPEGVHSGQSEQLPYFKDYYSADDIYPGDKVATLWAYQPRAADEFGLERGDMLKVIGIWDDGWATGVRISDRAEDYDGKTKAVQRDSGVSNVRRGSESSEPHGEVKAFPMVCVCLPEYWKKTIEGGSSSTNSTSPRHLDTRFPNF